ELLGHMGSRRAGLRLRQLESPAAGGSSVNRQAGGSAQQWLLQAHRAAFALAHRQPGADDPRVTAPSHPLPPRFPPTTRRPPTPAPAVPPLPTGVPPRSTSPIPSPSVSPIPSPSVSPSPTQRSARLR